MHYSFNLFKAIPIDELYYHRDYSKDLFTQNPLDRQDLIRRVLFVSLPFLGLWQPLNSPLSLGMGCVRVSTLFIQFIKNIQSGNLQDIPLDVLQTAIATAVLTTRLFSPVIGMLATGAYDFIFDFLSCIASIEHGDGKIFTESLLKLLNTTLYMALICLGNLPLAVVSLIFQMTIVSMYAVNELKQGHRLEALCHVLMGVIRFYQFGYFQFKILKMQQEAQANCKAAQKRQEELEAISRERQKEFNRVFEELEQRRKHTPIVMTGDLLW